MRTTSGSRVIRRRDAVAACTALAARYAADADWLGAVVAALDVIHANGVAPRPALLADTRFTARRAVHGVAMLPDLCRPCSPVSVKAVDALAAVATQYTAAVADETDPRADVVGLGWGEIRASLCLAVEILSLAARVALSIAQRMQRDRGWWRRCWPTTPDRR